MLTIDKDDARPPDGPPAVQVRNANWSSVRDRAREQLARARGKSAPPPAPPPTAPPLIRPPTRYVSRALEAAQDWAQHMAVEARETVDRNNRIYNRVTWLFVLANAPRMIFYFISLISAPPAWDDSDNWGSFTVWGATLGVSFILVSIPPGVDMLIRAGIRQLSALAIAPWRKAAASPAVLILVIIGGKVSYIAPLPPGLEPYRWLMVIPTIGVACSEFLRAMCVPSYSLIYRHESRAYAEAGIGTPEPPPPPPLPPPPPAVKRVVPNGEQRRENFEKAVAIALADPNLMGDLAKVSKNAIIKGSGVSFETAKKAIAEALKRLQAERERAAAEEAQKKKDARNAARRRPKQTDQTDGGDTSQQPPSADTPPAEAPKPVKATRAPRQRRVTPGDADVSLDGFDGLLDGAARASGGTRTKKVNGEHPELVGSKA